MQKPVISHSLPYTIQYLYIVPDMGDDSPSGFLRQRFQELGMSFDAFSSLEYIGTRTTTQPTDYTGLLNAITKQLMNTNVRSKRKPTVIFSALQVSLFHLHDVI